MRGPRLEHSLHSINTARLQEHLSHIYLICHQLEAHLNRLILPVISYTQQRLFQNSIYTQYILDHGHLMDSICGLCRGPAYFLLTFTITSSKKIMCKFLKERPGSKWSQEYPSALLLVKVFCILCSLLPAWPSSGYPGNPSQEGAPNCLGLK